MVSRALFVVCSRLRQITPRDGKFDKCRVCEVRYVCRCPRRATLQAPVLLRGLPCASAYFLCSPSSLLTYLDARATLLTLRRQALRPWPLSILRVSS